MDLETGNLVHAACLTQKAQAANEKDQAEPERSGDEMAPE